MEGMGTNACRHQLDRELEYLLESVYILENYYSPFKPSPGLNFCVCLQLLKEYFLLAEAVLTLSVMLERSSYVHPLNAPLNPLLGNA